MMTTLRMGIVDQIICSFYDDITTMTHIGLDSSFLITWTGFLSGVH